MKNVVKTLGITSMVLIIGLSFVTCSNGSTDDGGGAGGGGGTFTLTDIPATYNGMYAYMYGRLKSTGMPLWGSDNPKTQRNVRISDGRVSLPTWIQADIGSSYIRYTGNDNVDMTVYIVDSSSISTASNKALWSTGSNNYTIAFSNGSAVVSWNSSLGQVSIIRE